MEANRSQHGGGTAEPMLLHICCAPCATYPVQYLRGLGHEVTGFWYNPNIHPWTEHEARRTSLAGYAERLGLRLVWQPGYDTVGFLRAVAGLEARGERCAVCYTMRLDAAAARTRALGLGLFTTSLLISPYQDQKLIRAAGEAAAAAHRVRFHFESFRRGWSERSRLTREYDLYRQQYCGCLFSEFERYTKLEVGQAAGLRYEDR